MVRSPAQRAFLPEPLRARTAKAICIIQALLRANVDTKRDGRESAEKITGETSPPHIINLDSGGITQAQAHTHTRPTLDALVLGMCWGRDVGWKHLSRQQGKQNLLLAAQPNTLVSLPSSPRSRIIMRTPVWKEGGITRKTTTPQSNRLISAVSLTTLRRLDTSFGIHIFTHCFLVSLSLSPVRSKTRSRST